MATDWTPVSGWPYRELRIRPDCVSPTELARVTTQQNAPQRGSSERHLPRLPETRCLRQPALGDGDLPGRSCHMGAPPTAPVPGCIRSPTSGGASSSSDLSACKVLTRSSTAGNTGTLTAVRLDRSNKL